MKKKNNSTSFFTVLFAFVMGGVLMLGILKWTPVLDEVVGNGTNKSTIIDNKTQVYEKTSLAASVDKIKDAVMTVNGYTNGQLASTGTAFVYKKDDKYYVEQSLKGIYESSETEFAIVENFVKEKINSKKAEEAKTEEND